MRDTTSPDLDAIFTLLSDSRRRFVCYHFLKTDYATLENLSRRIAGWEADTAPRAVSEDDRERVATSLVHKHLPRLADEGVVDYDVRSGDIVAGDEFEAVRPFLEQASSAERAGEIPEPSHLTVLYSDPPEEEFFPEDA